MYRSAFIATGGRAISHAAAYQGVRSIKLVAAADIDSERAKKFGADYGVEHIYSDYRKMLAEQKPDIVHLITNPNVRVESVRACAEAGVKAMIVEKPMATSLSDAEAIEKIAADSGLKVIINTQRRFFPSWRQVCEVAKQAGRLRFVRCQATSAVMCTGSHYLDMVQMLLHDAEPVAVWSAAYGEEEYHCSHPGPANFLTSITYPDRLQVLYEASKNGAGIIGEDSYFMATEFDISGEKGHIWWTERGGWGYQLEGMAQEKRFETDFMKDDPIGQAAFTEAVATWLKDESKPHPNRLETAIRVFRIIAAMIQSAAENRRIDFEPSQLKDKTPDLRSKIAANEGSHPAEQAWEWKPRVRA